MKKSKRALSSFVKPGSGSTKASRGLQKALNKWNGENKRAERRIDKLIKKVIKQEKSGKGYRKVK
jgi:hypothetical protein